MVRRILTALVVLIGASIATAGAQAGAPRYIMVSGHGIAAPILLANWRENGKLETALSHAPEAAPSKSLARRPRLRLSLFWGWDEHRPARPGEANQYGWLYPASGTQPALVALMLDGSASLASQRHRFCAPSSATPCRSAGTYGRPDAIVAP